MTLSFFNILYPIIGGGLGILLPIFLYYFYSGIWLASNRNPIPLSKMLLDGVYLVQLVIAPGIIIYGSIYHLPLIIIGGILLFIVAIIVDNER